MCSFGKVTAERDAFEKERDTYIRQFDELSKTRNTQTEETFKSYREKAEARADSEFLARNQTKGTPPPSKKRRS